jgi:hypothetical protein
MWSDPDAIFRRTPPTGKEIGNEKADASIRLRNNADWQKANLRAASPFFEVSFGKEAKPSG